MNSYRLGSVVHLSTRVTVGSTLTDPTAITLVITKPDGTTVTPTPVHDGTGLYSYDYTPAVAGTPYIATWTATGTAAGVDEIEFEVVASSRHLVDVDDLKAWLTITDTTDDVTLGIAASAANRAVATYCGRNFEYVTTPTARTFRPDNAGLVYVNDFHTVTGLLVATDENDAGTFATSWATTDYQPEPLNGMDGPTASSYYRLRAVGNHYFPTCNRGASLQVTAAWGWLSVPDDVVTAALIKAARLWKRKDSPEGVLGGFAEMGAVRVTNREDPDVVALLRPYRRVDSMALIG